MTSTHNLVLEAKCLKYLLFSFSYTSRLQSAKGAVVSLTFRAQQYTSLKPVLLHTCLSVPPPRPPSPPPPPHTHTCIQFSSVKSFESSFWTIPNDRWLFLHTNYLIIYVTQLLFRTSAFRCDIPKL